MKRTLLKILICFLLVAMLSACVLGTPSQTPEATPTQTVSPIPTVEPTPIPTVQPTPTPPPDKVVEVEERFVVSQRSYDYFGYDTVILTIENVTDKAYDLKIKGNYLSADGNIIKTDEYFMYGFAPNSVNYCMFCPYIDYDDFEFVISSTEYTGEVLFNYVHRAQYAKSWIRENGNRFGERVELKNTSQKHIDKAIEVEIEAILWQTNPRALKIVAHCAIFDSNGKLIKIDTNPIFWNVGGSDKDYGNNEARPGSMTWISGTDNIEYKKHCTCLIGIMKVEYFTGYGN